MWLSGYPREELRGAKCLRHCLPLAKRSMWGDARGHRKPQYLVFVLGEPRSEVALDYGYRRARAGWREGKSLGLQTREPRNSSSLDLAVSVLLVQ